MCFAAHPSARIRRAMGCDPAISTNTSYRWDGVHYYKKGAALYFGAVVPQLLTSPPAKPPA